MKWQLGACCCWCTRQRFSTNPKWRPIGHFHPKKLSPMLHSQMETEIPETSLQLTPRPLFLLLRIEASKARGFEFCCLRKRGCGSACCALRKAQERWAHFHAGVAIYNGCRVPNFWKGATVVEDCAPTLISESEGQESMVCGFHSINASCSLRGPERRFDQSKIGLWNCCRQEG